MKTNIKMTISAAVLGAFALSACSAENVADNTSDAVIFVGKTAVKGAVGAGKYAYRGGKAAVTKARGSQADRGDFPAGTAVCSNASGGYYAALENAEGKFVCLPKEAV